jgi:hypothetical protein
MNSQEKRLEIQYREAIPVSDTRLANLCWRMDWPFKSHVQYPEETFHFPLETLRKAAAFYQNERRAHRRK